jgi:hypothetical protein
MNKLSVTEYNRMRAAVVKTMLEHSGVDSRVTFCALLNVALRLGFEMFRASGEKHPEARTMEAVSRIVNAWSEELHDESDHV